MSEHIIQSVHVSDAFLCTFILSEEENSCLAECPFQMNVSDLIVSASCFFPADSWVHLTSLQYEMKFLTPGNSVYVLNFIKNDERKRIAYSRNGLQQIKGKRIMDGSLSFDFFFDSINTEGNPPALPGRL